MWSDIKLVDCGSDGNVAHRISNILQQSADFVQGLNNSDYNMAESLVHVLHTLPYKKRLQVFERNYENYFIF
jgi:hypothetical protein